MSTELLKSLCDRAGGVENLPSDALQAIAAQEALAQLLATHPVSNLPSFLYGNGNKAVVYPCVTFRFSGGLPDPRFERGISAEDIFLDMEIWEDKGVAATITTIDTNLRLLFDEKKDAPQLPLESGLLALSLTVFTGLSTHYDEKRNAWFGLRRWKVRVLD